MLPKSLKSIYLEYLPRYESEVKSFQSYELQDLIEISAQDAKRNYKRLPTPLTCPLDIYTTIWIRQEVAKDLSVRTVRKISLDKPAHLFKAQANYFLLMPYELHGELQKRLYKSNLDKRKGVWQSFKLPVGEIERRFIQMTISRNDLALRKGHSSYVDMFLGEYKIPQLDYRRFVKNADRIIEYCNAQLPEIEKLPAWFYSIFNTPCFICRMTYFPFKTLDETAGYMAKKYRVLSDFKHKIKISLGENSKMFYKKETDSFEITINKNGNIRHQIVDLVHELSHVVTFIENLKKKINPLEKGAYWREKETLGVELAVLEKISPGLFQASFGEILATLFRVLFEIELYTNPKQNLNKLYAHTFNRCFKGANQESNPLYILDEYIVLHPLSTLPHAVATLNLFDDKNVLE